MGLVSLRTIRKMIKGAPLLEDDFPTIPHETLNEARVEVGDVMLQYTKCADPTEREARKERVRQVEERG